MTTGATVSLSNVPDITVALIVDRPELTEALIEDLRVISLEVALLVSARCVENIFARLITSDSETPSQPLAEICPRRWFS